jgi:hypothetical protein
MRRLASMTLPFIVLCALGAAAPAARAAIPPTGVGSATVVPVQVTGPPANRFDLVIAGDGYTAGEQDKFMAQVDKQLNILWSIEPYKTYRNYINVYAIKIISGDSGISCDPDLTSPRKTTPLNMAFWGGCNRNSVQRLVSVSNSQLNQYAALAPGVSQKLAIANSDTYGGAGGGNATSSGGNSMSALIAPHELGHTIGGLQDEYDYYQRGVPGDCYQGGEPASVHHTLYTVDQMLSGHLKWWRWLGEPSEAGGLIDRYEGGMYFAHCVWRPSAHSIMKTLSYYYDQVSREVMTQKISGKVKLVDASTPTDAPVGRDQVVWVETQHPVDHTLDVAWALDGTAIPGAANALDLDLGKLSLGAGTHTLTATVVDPTPFVRDPAIRNSAALTHTLSWTVADAPATPAAVAPAITASTPTDRPVGRDDVVYVETTHSTTAHTPVTWTLDGTALTQFAGQRNLPLAAVSPAAGRSHTLTAKVGDDSETWTVDATDAVTAATLSTPAAVVSPPGAEVPEYIFKGPFSLKLRATDDSPGYVVPEFRVDGDGWRNFYGWPTDANAPFQFSNTGTDIDLLNYGQLDYGRHVIEYRAIDPAGNIAASKRFIATYIDPEKSDVGSVSGTVPATLSLSVGAPASFGAFVPGLAKDYDATMPATVTSTAADATLTVDDPSSAAPGHLVNGAFALPQALLVNASSPLGTGGARAPVGGPVLTYSTPASNDPVTLAFRQTIGSGDALRTGSYAKTLTLTLSTTNP